MVERITVSAPAGTRDELIRLAHSEGMNLSRFLTDPTAQMTYICEHKCGKLKIGISNNPRVRTAKFGRLVAIIFDAAAEKSILHHFERVTAPEDMKEGLTEWIGVELSDVCDFVENQGFTILLVKDGYERKGKIGRPSSDGPKRSCTVNMNVTPDEKWIISDLAEKEGVSISDYMRIIFDKVLKENAQ